METDGQDTPGDTEELDVLCSSDTDVHITGTGMREFGRVVYDTLTILGWSVIFAIFVPILLILLFIDWFFGKYNGH